MLAGPAGAADARGRGGARARRRRLLPEGPEGAHKVTNRHAEAARIVILSTKNEPAISVYPDSNKVGAWPPGKLFRLDDAVDYLEGEA